MASFFELITDYERLSQVRLPQELQDEFDKYIDERACLIPPDIHNNIRSVRAHIGELVFTTKPYGTVSIPGQPNKRGEIVDTAEIKLSALIDISKFKDEASPTILQALYGGMSAGITEWHEEYRRVLKKKEGEPGEDGSIGLVPDLDDKGQFQFSYEKVIAYPRFRGIDVRRMRIDDKAEARKDIRIVGYHVKRNESDLLRENEDPDSFIQFKESDLQESSFPHDKYYEYVVETKPIEEKTDKAKYGDAPVEVIEIRGMFQMGGKYTDLIVKIANRKIIIEARPNNLPINGWELFDFPAIDSAHNRLYTMGLIEPIIDVFVEQVIKRGQSIDSSNRNAYEMYIADLVALGDLDHQITYRGGKIIPLNTQATGATDVGQVFQPIKRTADPQDTFRQSDVLANDVKAGMQRSDYVQLADPSRKETATAVNELTMAAVREMKQLLGFLAQTFLCPVWKKFLILDAFFGQKEKETLTADDGRELTVEPGDLDRAFEITVDVSAALDRPMAVRRITETLPLLLNHPLPDQYQLLRTALWFLNYPNREKVLPPPELKIFEIEAENIALKNGIFIPVHPNQDHKMHIQVHTARMQADAEDPDIDLSDVAIQAYQEHIKTHEQFLVQESQSAAGGSPAKSTEGPNTGQLVGGVSGKIQETVP